MGDNYTDGSKSLKTRFIEVYAHSSRTEQALKYMYIHVTMTPALYCHTTQTWYKAVAHGVAGAAQAVPLFWNCAYAHACMHA